MEQKTKTLIAEFKEFISRGNVVDMAVGVIIGTAFTSIVNSLVKEIVTPFLGWLIGGLDFSGYKLVLSAASGENPEVAVLYGSFLQQVVNFLLISLVVKLLNRFRRKKEEQPKAPAAPPADIVLLTEIRDLLKEQNAE